MLAIARLGGVFFSILVPLWPTGVEYPNKGRVATMKSKVRVF
jgi:hypothetical protein